jgi:nicotinamidase-related amidase
MTTHTDVDSPNSWVDPLLDQYRQTITAPANAHESVATQNTALLVIDIQYLDAARGYGVFANAERAGVPPDAQDYYFDRLERTVLPNIRGLQDAFRERRLEVIHTRIRSLTRDGRDRSAGHKRLGLHAAPGSKEAEFLPEVAPVGDEIIVNKTASGVFTSTHLEYILRNMGITGLWVCGVYTNECVSTTVRDASDLGFYTTLIEDGCATVTPELQANTINVLKDRYARVLATDAARLELERFLPSTRDASHAE